MPRRAVTRGLAWSTPAIAAAAAAPALAASTTSAGCPSTAAIDAAFAQRRTEVGTYDGCAGTSSPTFTIWYEGGGGGNGFAQSGDYNIRNQNPCTIDTTAYPLAFRIDVVNIAGPDAYTSSPGVLMRSLEVRNSYGYLASPATPTTLVKGIQDRTLFRSTGREQVRMADGTTAARTVYSAYWNISRAPSVNAGEDIDIRFAWGDGAVPQSEGGGRLQNAVRLVPLGMAAPTWTEITAAAPEQCPSYAHYEARSREWYANGYGCNPNITWDIATGVTTNLFSRTDRYRRTAITCGTGIWSNVSGDFTPANDGIY